MGQFTSITGKLDLKQKQHINNYAQHNTLVRTSFDSQAKDALKSLQWSRQDMEDLVLCCHESNNGGCTKFSKQFLN